MNRKTLVLMTVLALPAAAWADHDDRDGYREFARVVDVTPIYRTIQVSVPHRECYDELERVDRRGRDYRRPARSSGSLMPTIAGGVIGGAIGRQFGDGRGRDAMTVLGTVIGAAVASESSRDYRHDDHDGYHDYRHTRYSKARYRTVQRCEVAYETRHDRELDGYLVTYEYEGRTFRTRTDTHPGRRIAVDVEVRPVRGG